MADTCLQEDCANWDGDGNDDLALYRPGKGAIYVAHANGDGTFTAVLAVGDNGSALPNGIAGSDEIATEPPHVSASTRNCTPTPVR